MQRRQFLHASAVSIAANGLSAAGDALFPQARVGSPGTIDIGGRKQLFVDDLLLAEYSRISKFVYRPEKYAGNPVIVADKPWEMEFGNDTSGVQLDAQSSLYDEEDKLFKIWYLP